MNTETEAKPTVVLVDGNNYVYRAYYAIPELSNSKGFPRTRSTASQTC